MADNSTILEKLDGLVARFEEISTLITDPAVIADQKRYVKLTKEYKELDDLMKARKEYIQLLGNIEEAKNILANESDAEMREMAKEEMDNSQERLPVLEEEIKLMLVPADPQDSKNAILEIRGGAGGDEAAIFAGDLFRMYAKFCETKGWKMEVSNANEGTAGGFKEVVCSVTGDNVYGILKYESGVHRVQRVPATETQGRVHTSTATVLVMPEADEVDSELDMNDVRVDITRSSGCGGQGVNTTDSAVRLTHIPTGLVVYSQTERSQIKNKEKAIKILQARLYDLKMQEHEKEVGAERRSKIGTGDRSEKIRTYNYPQNRVTDHRIGFTLKQLDRVMEGNLHEIIDALINEDQARKLRGEE